MDILDRFLAQAEENILNGYYDNFTEQEFEKQSLKRALNLRQFSIIAEIKHASPAGEYAFDRIDVEKAAISFRSAGADALSVVTEPKIFQGNLESVSKAKKAGLPVLFKDFIISEKQVRAARMCGADCILLIVKAARRLSLDIHKLIKTAHTNGLEVLLECYDANEMREAIGTEADILGINNRDLDTLRVDLNRTKDIIANMKNGLDRPLISESGIKNKSDAEFVKKCGANGMLVGTALWKAKNYADKIRELKLAE